MDNCMNLSNEVLSDLTLQNRYCLYKSNLTDHNHLWCEPATDPSLSHKVADGATLGELNGWSSIDGTGWNHSKTLRVLPCAAPGRKREGELEFCFFPLHIPCSWHWPAFLHMVFLCQHSSFLVYLLVQFFSVRFLGQILLYISSGKPAAGPHATCECDFPMVQSSKSCSSVIPPRNQLPHQWKGGAFKHIKVFSGSELLPELLLWLRCSQRSSTFSHTVS